MTARAPLVRRGTRDDAAAIARVDVESWRAAYRGLMPDAYLDALSVDGKTATWTAGLAREEQRGKRTFVAVDAGDVVGYATIGPDEGSRDGLLWLMYVAPSHWRRGHGRALLDAAVDALREMGYATAALWVLERNARARAFYEAAGWRPDGATQSNEYGGMPLTAMRYARAL